MYYTKYASGASTSFAPEADEIPEVVPIRQKRWWDAHVPADVWPYDRSLLKHYLKHAGDEDGCSYWGTGTLAANFNVCRQTILSSRQRLVNSGCIRVLTREEKISLGYNPSLAVVQLVGWQETWIKSAGQIDNQNSGWAQTLTQTPTLTPTQKIIAAAPPMDQPTPAAAAIFVVGEAEPAPVAVPAPRQPAAPLSPAAAKLIDIGVDEELVRSIIDPNRLQDVADYLPRRHPNRQVKQARLGAWLLRDPKRTVPISPKRRSRPVVSPKPGDKPPDLPAPEEVTAAIGAVENEFMVARRAMKAAKEARSAP